MYWSVHFVVAVDRADRRVPSVKMDQWVQPSVDSVRLVNLYAHGSTAPTLTPGVDFYAWHSQLEATPAQWLA